MRRFALALALVTAAPLAAQEAPLLTPEAVRETMRATVARGWVADSAATATVACADTGMPLTRSALVGVVADEMCRQSEHGCDYFRGTSGGFTEADEAPVWEDSLLALGLLRETESERLRAVRRGYAEDNRAVPPEAILTALQLMPQWISRWEAASPELLRADAAIWVRAGLMAPEAVPGLLADAEASRLPLGSPLAPRFTIATPIGAPLSMERDLVASPSLVRDAVAALNARLDRPLALGEVRVDVRTREGYRGRTDTTQTLVAVLDGQVVEKLVSYGNGVGAVTSLLNQALRDRRSDVRVGLTVSTTNDAPLAAQAYLVAVDEAQLQAFSFNPSRPDSPRYALYERLLALVPTPEVQEACSFNVRNAVYELLEFQPIRWFGSAPSFDDDSMRRSSIRAGYATFARVGLIPEDSVDVATQRFLAHPYGPGSGADLLALTPVLRGFDYEVVTETPDYVALARHWSEVSRGAWTPTDLRETWTASGDSLTFEMHVGNREYRETLPAWEYATTSALLQLFARSAAEAGADGQFYWVGEGYESFAFLTAEQAEALSVLLPVLKPVLTE